MVGIKARADKRLLKDMGHLADRLIQHGGITVFPTW